MATFMYRGRAAAGAVTGEIEATDRMTAVAQLRSKGIVATPVAERNPTAARAGLGLAARFGGKVKDKDLAIYPRQSAAMIDAGLPIAQCLTILGEQTESNNLRTATQQIAKDVEGGGALADSFRKYPRIFNDLYTNMLQAGEPAGVLGVVLQRPCAHIEKAAPPKRQGKGAPGDPPTIIFGGGLCAIFTSRFFISPLKTMFAGLRARSAGNRVVERAVMQARAAVTAGRTLSEPLRSAAVFPPMVVHMIHVGESTGALDQMLSKIADFYDDEVDTAVGALMSLLEPAMIVILGVIIGGLVIALYLPIFKIVTLIK